jgi:nitrous oxidase accessory protein
MVNPMPKWLVLILILVTLSFTTRNASAQTGATLIVSPQGPYTTISSALDDAVDGDLIEVHGGSYSGPLEINKSISLSGFDWPVIDGKNSGTVVKLTAPGSTLRGFVIRNSGASLDQENSGVAGEAPNLLIENNRLEETLFGIYLRKASGSIVRDNLILGKDLDLPRRGDPIRVWYSNDTLIEGNTVDNGRDVVLWYSENLTVSGNTVSNGRYGLHFMYCDDAVITNNRLIFNSVGTFMMYSRRLNLINNTIAYNHGPSGFGIGLKDMDDAVVEGNLFLGNRVGAHLDNSPREVDSIGTFEGNLFAYNDIGINLMPSVRHNRFSGNSFIENQEQVSIGGGGMTQDNLWTVGGKGNYWSDYAGYDQDLDGIGDEIYRADRLFENLVDRYPELRLFSYSPSAQAVDFAAKAIPFVRPQPKMSDEKPLMAPQFPNDLPSLPFESSPWLPWLSTGLVAMGTIILFGTRNHSISPRSTAATSSHVVSAVSGEGAGESRMPLIHITGLTKRFRGINVVDDLSFEISSGEAVALWGPNGAGKTTTLRCLIGLIPFEGEVLVNSYDVQKHGKIVRSFVGFVPQELSFHDDLTIDETIRFYAQLKKVPSLSEGHSQPLLERVGLTDHNGKKVRELSGGLKQRLALAIALLGDPPILILDEPTSNLDARARDYFLDLLLELKGEGMTMCFSSHRLEEIATLADRVLLLDNGKLVADCPPHELSDQSGWNVTLRLKLDPMDMEQAMATLSQHGFSAHSNGKGIRVKVTPGHKGQPIELLITAGIQVEDFEIEQLNGS